MSEKKSFVRELIELILLAAVIVIPFRLFIAQPFIVDGTSMNPTFRDGQYLIVDEISYRFTEPERGSVIIFKYPKDPSKKFIKRIIGLPEERVSINNGQVTITNEENPEGLVLEEPYVKFPKTDFMEVQLDEGEYFVMGDNRTAS
ncbi:MAG: signal peptidase I, partial [bacterium]|nr:signal peptidase I [bacterium]